MPFCNICQSINFADFINSIASQRRCELPQNLGCPQELFPAHHDLFHYPEISHDELGKFCIRHHESVACLQMSAATCDLCRLIQSCISPTLANMAKASSLDFLRYQEILANCELWLCRIQDADGFQIISPGSNNTNMTRDWMLLGGTGICVKNGSILDSIIKGRELPISPRSPPALRTIGHWIAECTQQHQQAEPHQTPLPTRVLEITDGGLKVILCQSFGKNGKYAALSHCWGAVQPAKLTKSTLEQLSSGVMSTSLPQTYQDAVFMTNHIGIRYLWIDSLCIIQDDPSDWARESARMADVYTNAFITIAASRSENSAKGFLSDRPERKYLPIAVTLPHSGTNVSGEILAFALPVKYAVRRDRLISLEDEPLTDRGWALQERYLSRRILHFGQSQMFFECRNNFLAEDGTISSQFSYIMSTWDTRKWPFIVREFSQRKLTMAVDKLPAVAGLANLISRGSVENGTSPVPCRRYLAGLWWDDLIHGLCWNINTRKHTGIRPNLYRAPTWSWASVDGPVEFTLFDNPCQLAAVKDAHVDHYTSENPLGMVTDGWIWLRGIKLQPREIKCSEYGSCYLDFLEHGVGFYIYADWDTAKLTTSDSDKMSHICNQKAQLFAIPLNYNASQEVRNPTSLIGPFMLLVKESQHQVPSHPGKQSFERVGGGFVIPHERQNIKGLIVNKWLAAKERDEIEDVLLI